ncbi:MAG: hypothetical protein K6T65_01435 [Peptococcaceae bacterium]|nr:hypothetical protein [Peptococcaceae bacterium]
MMQAGNIATLNYVVATRKGSESTVAERIKKVAQRCREIVSTAPFLPGYVRVEVVAGENAEIKAAKLDMPKNARMVIELVPGVIKVCGNGKETVPLEE